MTDFGPLLSAAELAGRIDDQGLRVLDCRFDLARPDAGYAAYLEGHLPGAIHAHLDDDLSGPVTAASGRHPLPTAAAAAATMSRFGIDSDTTVVVYDASGGAVAARAWWLLRWLGHDRVALLDGGIAAWTAAGGALEPGEVAVPRADFRPRPLDDRIISTEQVAARLAEDENFRLADARDAARFRGEREPIDKVAGHVPGAISLPFADQLDADGRLRPPDELEARLAAALGGKPRARQDWAVMCGSGVTACHLALAAELSGLPPPLLYVGSWSEWIRDPSRPVATGP